MRYLSSQRSKVNIHSLLKGGEIGARLENVKLHAMIEELLQVRRRLSIACFSG